MISKWKKSIYILCALGLIGSHLTGCKANETSVEPIDEVVQESQTTQEESSTEDKRSNQKDAVVGKIINSNLKFSNLLSIEELRQLEGEQVTITGFMSTLSPLHGKYIYLMNMPYQSCVFCVPNTSQLVNTIPVYAKPGKTIEYTDMPVTITGTLVFESTVDDIGYSYEYFIADAKVEIADITGLEDDIRIYTALIDKGFATSYQKLMEDLYARINYVMMGKTEEELTKVDPNQINHLKELFNDLDTSEYEDILAVIDDTANLLAEVNEMIETEDYDALELLNDEGQNIYNAYYEWLVKPQI